MMEAEWKAAVKATETRAAMKAATEAVGKRGEAENATVVAPSPPGGAQTSATSGASTGAGGTTTYVSNITLPNGRKETMRFADAQSQSASERLLRDLAAGKGVAQ